jgi:hypothetical protein
VYQCIKLNKVQIITEEFYFIIHIKEVINVSKNNSKKKPGTKGTKDKQQKNNQKGNTVG